MLPPGTLQEILHVVAPHYVHMFESIFSSKRPWVFGHLYLPGGSKSLGAPTHALASGSKAPLVGVLMQVGWCRLPVRRGAWVGRAGGRQHEGCFVARPTASVYTAQV